MTASKSDPKSGPKSEPRSEPKIGPKASAPRRSKPAARTSSADADRSRARELTARLVHDVGKYLARTARNLPADCAPDPALLAMLCRDLYGDSRSPRPATRFAELAAELAPLLPAAPPVAADGAAAELTPPPAATLAAVGGELAELDGLEGAVRAGAADAVVRAVALARRIEQQLRALATAGQRPTRGRAR